MDCMVMSWYLPYQVDEVGDAYHCRGFFGNVLLMHYLAVHVLEVGVELLVGALPAIVAP